ncbi:hypothetical protein, partial [Limnofasciculus baicalensis]
LSVRIDEGLSGKRVSQNWSEISSHVAVAVGRMPSASYGHTRYRTVCLTLDCLNMQKFPICVKLF